MRVKLTPEAIEDIAEIKKYIREDLSSPIAANRTATNITKSYKRLKDFPLLGVSLCARYGIDTPVHMLVSGNYLIFYEINERAKLVEILNIIHSKQDAIRKLFPDFEYDIDEDDYDDAPE